MHMTELELQLRKEKIIHRAFDLFSQKGLDKVTMEEISKAAGVGVASVYRYFNTKAELAFRTQQILWDEVQQQITADLYNDAYEEKSGFEQLCMLIDGFENLYNNHSGYLLFAADYKMYLIRSNLKISGADYEAMLKPVHKLFKDALAKGSKDLSLSVKGNADDIFYTIWGILRSYIDEIIIYDHMADGSNPWTTRLHFIRSMILHQLNNKAGSDIFN